jgi:hypothetical protein
MAIPYFRKLYPEIQWEAILAFYAGGAHPAEPAVTLRTGSAERMPNMEAFAKPALELLAEVIPET